MHPIDAVEMEWSLFTRDAEVSDYLCTIVLCYDVAACHDLLLLRWSGPCLQRCRGAKRLLPLCYAMLCLHVVSPCYMEWFLFTRDAEVPSCFTVVLFYVVPARHNRLLLRWAGHCSFLMQRCQNTGPALPCPALPCPMPTLCSACML